MVVVDEFEAPSKKFMALVRRISENPTSTLTEMLSPEAIEDISSPEIVLPLLSLIVTETLLLGIPLASRYSSTFDSTVDVDWVS